MLKFDCKLMCAQEPAEVLIPEAITQVSAGFYHTLCVAASGNVWSMGSNARGQLGLGKDLPGTVSPRLIKALLGAHFGNRACQCRVCRP